MRYPERQRQLAAEGVRATEAVRVERLVQPIFSTAILLGFAVDEAHQSLQYRFLLL